MSSTRDSPRHRNLPNTPSNIKTPAATKQINAASSLERFKLAAEPDNGLTPSIIIGTAITTLGGVIPSLVSWGTIMSLIFGGCCSNVFALETIVKEEPRSGHLITFIQFLVTALLTWPTHFSASHPPFYLKPRAVPLTRWLPNIFLFFTVNVLNNFAFGYNISVPVHIILRSGGSVTTMLVGFLWGKRYSQMQVFSVAMLTVGIIIAAMADAQSKGKASTGNSKIDPSFVTGLFILALAQLLSAIMGLYTQLTYAAYGSHWHENLFYSHFLSIPFFLPFLPSLLTNFRHLLSSSPITVFPSILSLKSTTATSTEPLGPIPLSPTWPSITVPRHIVNLLLNALTQYACIRGVNLLSARTTALGVSIVLNVRKLVSLFASIWIFGNRLPVGVLLGAAIVFASAAVWAAEGQRLRRQGQGREEKKGQ